MPRYKRKNTAECLETVSPQTSTNTKGSRKETVTCNEEKKWKKNKIISIVLQTVTANGSVQQITHCTRNAFKKKKKSTPQSAYVSIPQKLLFRNGFQNVHCIFLQP